MSGRVPVRGGSHLRRSQSVRRASARISLTRVAAVGVLFAASVALNQLTAASAFAVHRVDIQGAQLTDRGEVADALLDGAGANLFRYDTAMAAARLVRFPAIRTAVVRAVLPDRVVATIEEREPVLVWRVGDERFLVDADGLLFAREGQGAGLADPVDLPVVTDARPGSAGLAITSLIAPVELRVARELGALTPAMLGSAAVGLTVSLDDQLGFVVATDPPGWSATFGLYGEVTRNPQIVPLQVQCLASLLADQGEAAVGSVTLSPEGQLCGTFGQP
jgi:cell division septal protein FtsQ